MYKTCGKWFVAFTSRGYPSHTNVHVYTSSLDPKFFVQFSSLYGQGSDFRIFENTEEYGGIQKNTAGWQLCTQYISGNAHMQYLVMGECYAVRQHTCIL